MERAGKGCCSRDCVRCRACVTWACVLEGWLNGNDTEGQGGFVKYTAQYFAGARFVAVNPKLSRNSNCYMGIGRLRLYVDTPWRERTIHGYNGTFPDRNRDGHLVKLNCRAAINFTVPDFFVISSVKREVSEGGSAE